jgi:3-oxoacyl-[acyl-carrier-protein] synthase II
MNVAITGIGLTSGLGDGAQAHREKLAAGEHALRPLAKLFGEDSPYAAVNAAWIENRKIMLSRKWAPASMLSLHVAKQAVADAGLSAEDLKDAAVIVGSSRGNVAGWVSEWPLRRPFKLMAASNSMHGELASAVSIELGIRGPWQVISSGCAASLDAMGMASMMIQQGMAKRAIVIGVELPLIPAVLKAYADTGVLASSMVNDPYSSHTSGLFPAEAGAALVLEAVTNQASERLRSRPLMTGYWCNSDADSPIGMPSDGSGLRACLEQAHAGLKDEPAIAAICPHASGTLLHAKAELAALKAVLPVDQPISLHPLKPYTGHSVGANGVLDCAILASYLQNRELPPNLDGITCPGAPFKLEANPLSKQGTTVLKIAVGMGGHNSIVSLRSPSA